MVILIWVSCCFPLYWQRLARKTASRVGSPLEAAGSATHLYTGMVLPLNSWVGMLDSSKLLWPSTVCDMSIPCLRWCKGLLPCNMSYVQALSPQCYNFPYRYHIPTRLFAKNLSLWYVLGTWLSPFILLGFHILIFGYSFPCWQPSWFSSRQTHSLLDLAFTNLCCLQMFMSRVWCLQLISSHDFLLLLTLLILLIKIHVSPLYITLYSVVHSLHSV